MLLIIDANVLIDYAQSDASILTLAARHLGTLFVPRVVLDEVSQLSESDCDALGLTLVDESFDILASAAAKQGSLSFEDQICLLMAKQEQWTCVTNDKRLHLECSREGVDVIRGLRLMIELVRAEGLEPETAMEIAHMIHEFNPRHITVEILASLEEKLAQIERGE